MSSGDSDQQSFDLVVAVLPRVEELLKEEIKRLKKKLWVMKKDQSDYVGKIRPSVETFRNHVASVKDDASLSSPLLINGIAQCLEGMFSASILQDGPRQDPYPRLHAFAAAAKKEPNTWPPQNLFLAFSNPAYWNMLLKNLHLVVTLIESNTNVTPSNLPASPSPTASTGDHEEAWKFSELLFRAVHCSCAEEGPAKVERESMLGLEMWKASTPAIVRKSSLLVKEKGEWHKLLIMGASAERSVQFAGCGSIQGPTSPVPPLEECLCKQLRKNTMPQKLQQTLRLRPPALQFSNEKIEPRDGTLADRISLRELIASRPADWKTASRLALAFILASSLCYLYGGTWTRGGWSPARIFLDKEGPLVHLCAFLEAHLLLRQQSGISGGGARAGFNLYPDIRQLGLVLLEIHLGELLETYLPKQFPERPPRVLNQEDIYLDALNLLRLESASFSSPSYWHAIDTCLKFPNVAGHEANDKEVRQVLFQKIVEPLGTELERLPFFRTTLLWSVNIDEEIALSNQLAVRMSSAFAVSKNGQRRHQDGGIARTGPAWAGSPPAAAAQAENPPMADSRTARENPREVLYDSRGSTEDHAHKASRKWIDDFIKFRTSILVPFQQSTMQRVRITVIDTGIDDTHPFIKKQGWRRLRWDETPLFEDFTTSDDTTKYHPVDDDGHGTFIAGLILQLAPDIELSVARVIQDQTTKKDPGLEGKIAEAINHAVNTWKAEIISISFGLDGKSRVVQTAIDNALHKNVILLGAAGNFANERDVSYPASAERVFKIFATTPRNWGDDMNPPARMGLDYCFGVLGRDVESTWPSRLKAKALSRNLRFTDRSVSDEELWTVMSGTSFATPIAASLVAIIYQFYNENKRKIKLSKNSEGFKSIAVVRAVLKAMSRPAGKGDKFNMLSPELGRENHFKYDPEMGEKKIPFYAERLRIAIWASNE